MTSHALFFFSPFHRAYIPFTKLSFYQPSNPAAHPLTSSPPTLSSIFFTFFFSSTRLPRVIPKEQPSFGHSLEPVHPTRQSILSFSSRLPSHVLRAPPNHPIPWKGSRPGAMALSPIPRSLSLSLPPRCPLVVPKSSVPPTLHNRRIMCFVF